MHKDVMGNDLAIGDKVFVAGEGSKGKVSKLVQRVVVGFTKQMIRVDEVDESKRNRWTQALRFPYAVVLVNETSKAVDYEYGINFYKDDLQDPHRFDMTFEEAQAWVDDFEADCPPGNRVREAWRVIRRPQGEWQLV